MKMRQDNLYTEFHESSLSGRMVKMSNKRIKHYLNENRQYNDHAMGVVGPAVGDEEDGGGESSEGEKGGVGEEEGGED